MTRREAREYAIGLLFEYSFRTAEDAGEIYSSAVEVREIPEDDFVRSLYTGVIDNLEAVDAAISANLHGWKPERISGVSRAILRLGVYEILFCDTPDESAVNEAIELVKKYDDEKARPFVNAVLNAVMKGKGTEASV